MKFYFTKNFLLLLASLLLSCSSLKTNESSKTQSCEVTLVGGGPAGVYLGYRLAPTYKNKLCLFEKESSLGGRMLDVTQSGNPEDIWIGTGARRVNEIQSFVLALAKELNITLETPAPKKQLIRTSKRFAHSANDFVQDFPGLQGPFDNDPSSSREDEIYSKLLQEKSKAVNYPDLRSFIEDITGKESFQYLRSVSRFHGDFDYELSASNYLAVLEEEFKISTTNLYPVGGMSAFIRAMEAELKKQGVQVFTGEAVLQFDSQGKNIFSVQTSKRKFSTKKLVFAIPPSGFDHVQGRLADEIKQSPEYQSLLPIPIVVINQWWEKSWWEQMDVWRAWSNDGCVNHTEIPQEAYAQRALATRSVYTDDPKCVRYWTELMKTQGISAVEKEVTLGLQKLFKGMKAPSSSRWPKALKTSFTYWPAGWYYMKANTKVTTQQLIQWSQQPLEKFPNLMLIGEAYWPTRPGWSEGAYFSAEEILKKKFR